MVQPRELAAGGVLRRQPPTFADLVAAEEEKAKAGAQACGYTCLCHGGHTCIRLAHPHDPGQDMGEGAPRGNVVPHVGRDADGALVQWTCTDPTQQAMTVDDHAKAAADAKTAHAKALLDGLDLDTLKALAAAKEASG